MTSRSEWEAYVFFVWQSLQRTRSLLVNLQCIKRERPWSFHSYFLLTYYRLSAVSFSGSGLPWKRVAADSLREKKMSHMTVGQRTPEVVMTLKMRSTYWRRFSWGEEGDRRDHTPQTNNRRTQQRHNPASYPVRLQVLWLFELDRIDFTRFVFCADLWWGIEAR